MKNSQNPIIFIVDGNDSYQKITTRFLNIAGYYEILSFSDYSSCIEYLDLEPDIIIAEDIYHNGPINGQFFLDIVKENNPETMFIFFTSGCKLENAVNYIHKGAIDYILKSKYAHERLVNIINNINRYKKDIYENNRIRKRITASIGILVVIMVSLVVLYNG